MKKRKKNVVLLSIFYMLFCASLWAQSFRAVDLERLLRNHPITGRYDSITGRFRNTPSEILKVEVLQNQIYNLVCVIKESEAKKKVLVKKSIIELFDAGSEEALWESIRAIDTTIQKAKDELAEKENLLRMGGTPSIEKLQDVIQGIFRDVRQQYSHGGKAIILNRLPTYISAPSDLRYGRDGLLKFFYNKSDETLKSYIQNSYSIGMLFPATTDPIVFQKEEQKEEQNER